MARIASLISGGETGVDRAALDIAIARRIAYRGFVPKGGWAEDCPDPPGLLARYPNLTETESRNPDVRTERNVLAGDATLIIQRGKAISPGTDFTIEMAARHGKPLFAIDASDRRSLADTAAALREVPGEIGLNVAGPRESEAPGIYLIARRIVEALLDEIQG